MKVMVPFLKSIQDPSKGKVAPRKLSNVVFQIFLFGLLMALLFSCKVYRNIDYINPPIPKGERSKTFEPRQIERVEPGDKLYLVMKNETSYDIVYSIVENDSIKGVFLQKNNKRIKIPIETGVSINEVLSLKVKKTSIPATLGLMFGVGTLSLILVTDMVFTSYSDFVIHI